MPGFMSAGSQTNVGGGGASSSSSSFSSSSQSESQTQEIQSNGDPFGMNGLQQLAGSAGRKKRELPVPADGDSSSFIDTLVRNKRSLGK
jgi:hypothetical protein